MTAVAMRASSYHDLMQEALADFKAWERRMVQQRRRKGEGQVVPEELAVSASEDGACIYCERPSVLRGMCRRHYLQWYLKAQKAKKEGKGLESGS